MKFAIFTFLLGATLLFFVMGQSINVPHALMGGTTGLILALVTLRAKPLLYLLITSFYVATVYCLFTGGERLSSFIFSGLTTLGALRIAGSVYSELYNKKVIRCFLSYPEQERALIIRGILPRMAKRTNEISEECEDVYEYHLRKIHKNLQENPTALSTLPRWLYEVAIGAMREEMVAHDATMKTPKRVAIKKTCHKRKVQRTQLACWNKKENPLNQRAGFLIERVHRCFESFDGDRFDDFCDARCE